MRQQLLALEVDKLQGSIMIDYEDGVATLDVHNFCPQSQLRNSETDVTHGALFFECNSIVKLISPYQKIV